VGYPKDPYRAALQALSHRLMERALRLLDKSGTSVPAIHLDRAIALLGLRASPLVGANDDNREADHNMAPDE
jgi:hypothetical protein